MTKTSQSWLNSYRQWMSVHVVVALFLAVAIAWLLPTLGNALAPFFGFIATGSLQIITMLVPFIVSLSLFSAVAQDEDSKNIGFAVPIALICFAVTTTLAATSAFIFSGLFNPASLVTEEMRQGVMNQDLPSNLAAMSASAADAQFSIGALANQLVPSNLVGDFLESNLLALIVLSVLGGLAAKYVGRKNADVRNYAQGANGILDVFMKMLDWVMLLVPFAAFGFALNSFLNAGFDSLKPLFVFAAMVLSGLLTIAVLYVILLSLLNRCSPWRTVQMMLPAVQVAFGVASSSAALPYTMRVTHENMNVRKELASLIPATGATVNMDGTSFFQLSVILLGIGMFGGPELVEQLGSFGFLATLVGMVVAYSVGVPGIPGGSLVVIMMILYSLGIEEALYVIMFILPIDRLLDMCRTVINVSGDITVTKLTDVLEPKIEQIFIKK